MDNTGKEVCSKTIKMFVRRHPTIGKAARIVQLNFNTVWVKRFSQVIIIQYGEEIVPYSLSCC